MAKAAARVGLTAILPMALVLLSLTASAELRVSQLNPRYLVDRSNPGRAIFLAGTQTWLTLRDGGEAPTIPQVPPFNWQGYLNFLTQQGHNYTKFRTWESDWNNCLSWVQDFRYGPYSIYKRTGPGFAEDGFWKFNLDSLDQRYFDRVKIRTDTLARRGIYVEIQLFDGWAVSTKGLSGGQNPFQGHPYNVNNNVQGMGFPDNKGDSTQVLPWQGGRSVILAYQVAYVKKMIDELNDRDNVLWEICNEPNANAQDWQYAIIDTIKNYESRKPKQHPVVMATEYPDIFGGTSEETLNPTRNNDGSANTYDYSQQVDNDTVKVILTDSDHICGECMDGPWVYESVCNGVGGIAFMDPWDGRDYPHMVQNYDSSAYSWVSARKAMGQMQRLANFLNVIDMRPTPNLSTTGYCLSGNRKWIIYRPGTGGFIVNLTATTDSLNVRWLNVNDGSVQVGVKIRGGSSGQIFTPPSSNHDILYLYSDAVVTIPPPPALTSPFNGATNQPTPCPVSWHRSNGATAYRVQLSRDSLFLLTILDDSTVTDTLRQVAALFNNTTYFWRVSAKNPAGSSAWSPSWRFTTATTTTLQMAMADQWNLISVPLTVDDMHVSALFPSAISRAFGFMQGAGYLPLDTLVHGIGYWLKFAGAQNVGITGLVRVRDTIMVGTGWNFIGSVSFPVDTAAVQCIPPGIRGSPFYQFATGYIPAAVITPGRAYWVKINAPGQLVLVAGALGPSTGSHPVSLTSP